MFLYAEPMNTGVSFSSIVPLRMADLMRSSVTRSSRIASVSSSENIDAASSSSSRALAACSWSSAGISDSAMTSPSLPLKRTAFMVTRSTTPSNLSSRPMGSCISTGLCWSFSRSWSFTRSGFAPDRSHLLTKARRGTL